MIRVGSMKRQFVIPSLGIVVISASAACFAQQVNAMVSRAFENACHNGADARVEFHVVDDVGKPVPLAKVNVFFDMMDRSKGRRIIGDTDTNGIFVAEAKTGGVLEIEVSREGHYRSTDLISFIGMGHEHEVIKGKLSRFMIGYWVYNTCKCLQILSNRRFFGILTADESKIVV